MNRVLIINTFKHPPVFYTDRLKFRPLSVSDAKDMFEYSSLPEVTKYLTWHEHKSLRFTKKYLKNVERSYSEGRYFDWGLENRSDGKMIGTCGFTSFSYLSNKCEIGYVINPAYQHMSYATEAANAVIDYAFIRFECDTVSARCVAGNIASMRVMEKCGMKYSKTYDDFLMPDGRKVCVVEFTLSRSDYLANCQI